MIIGMYLFTPFLRQFVAVSSPRLLSFFLIVAFLISATESIVGNVKGVGHGTFLGLFPSFIAYFVAGYHLRLLSRKTHGGLLIAVAASCAALIPLGTEALIPALGPRSSLVMCSWQNPLVIIMSLCIYQFAVGTRPPSQAIPSGRWVTLVHRMAPVTLGIYVIHPFLRDILSKWGMSGVFLPPMLGIPAKSLVVFGLSAALAMLLGGIPFARATVK
jgi:surface polysaccharide O-acyltransferase-like enzyme